MRSTNPSIALQSLFRVQFGHTMLQATAIDGIYYGYVVDSYANNPSIKENCCRIVIPELDGSTSWSDVPYPGTDAPPNGVTVIAGFLQGYSPVVLAFVGWHEAQNVYTGEGAPTDDLGLEGDVYIDSVNHNLYIKGVSTWGSPIPIGGGGGGAANYAAPLTYDAGTNTVGLSTPLAKTYGGTGNTTGQPSGAAGGDLSGTYPSPDLAASGVAAATYGSTTQVPQITVDAKGRINNASNVTISPNNINAMHGLDAKFTYITGVTPATYNISDGEFALISTSGTYAGTGTAQLPAGSSVGDRAHVAVQIIGGTSLTLQVAFGDTIVVNQGNSVSYLYLQANEFVELLYDSTTSSWVVISSGTGISYESSTHAISKASGDLAGYYPAPALAASGVTAGVYGSGYNVPQITVDSKGRVTYATNVAVKMATTLQGLYYTSNATVYSNTMAYVAVGTGKTLTIASSVLSADNPIIGFFYYSGSGTLTISAPGSTTFLTTGTTTYTLTKTNQYVVFVFDSNYSNWVPISVGDPAGPAGGDLTGTYPNPSVIAGSTTQAGKLQLTDSISSTSITTAATPNSVKTAYDLANAAVPKYGGTLSSNLSASGYKITNLANGTASGDAVTFGQLPASGFNDIWTTGQLQGSSVTISSGSGSAVNPGGQSVTVSGYTTYMVIYNCAQTTGATTINRAINFYLTASTGTLFGVGSGPSSLLIIGNTNSTTTRQNYSATTVITTSTSGSVTLTPYLYLGGTTDTQSMTLFSMQVVGIK